MYGFVISLVKERCPSSSIKCCRVDTLIFSVYDSRIEIKKLDTGACSDSYSLTFKVAP